MVEINLFAAALLFPSVSLLLLAYTNRFLALAALIRTLHKDFCEHGENQRLAKEQIANLYTRIGLIQKMQFAGVVSIFASTLCMFAIVFGLQAVAVGLFSFALFAMLISLGYSLYEIHLSNNALNVLLQEID